MGILDTLLSLLGLGDSSSDDERRETTVSVEREANTDTEAAIKGTDESNARASEAESPVGGTDEATESAGLDDAETTDAESVEIDDAEESATDAESVEVIKGIGPAYAERLSNAGVNSVADLAAADAAELAEEIDLSETRVGRWIERATDR